MTKAERLAAKIQRDRENLASLQGEIRQSESALREETRKALEIRRYQVGVLAEESGLFVMSNVELAKVFAALGALRRGERPGLVLEGLVRDPETCAEGSVNGTGRESVRETTSENSSAR